MKVTKSTGLEHTFNYEGEEVKLTLNNSFTTQAYKDFKQKLQTAGDSEDVGQVCELACFFIRSWNLEDDAGDIPLTLEGVAGRVPLVILTEVLREAQEAVSRGGLSKKTGS